MLPLSEVNHSNCYLSGLSQTWTIADTIRLFEQGPGGRARPRGDRNAAWKNRALREKNFDCCPADFLEFPFHDHKRIS